MLDPVRVVPRKRPSLRWLFPALALSLGSVHAAPPALQPAAFGPATPRTALDLAELPDATTQRALDQCLQRLGLKEAVRARKLGVSLVDITDPGRPALAQANGDHMFYAASLPKIAILLGAFAKAEAGALRLDAAAIASLQRMIRHSSNSAASEMFDRVGVDFLAGVLTSPRYRLYDPQRNGGLWVGRGYGGGGRKVRRDPLHNLSHGATAYQVARFYYLLETGQLVSPEASRRMKAILGEPALRHKFVAGLSGTRAALYRKSGTWRTFHSDSAIVEHDGRRYIAVALSDDARGGEWLQRLIVGLDGIVVARAPATQAVASPERAGASSAAM